ncbi:Transmembrane 9 superfamily member 1 like protein [Verticillium longisporum]|uniref:Transmembrane 9 superfamily member n=3 Tax=Verticillium longisporum TaxID=100787 RepID=A0A8I3ASD9_VERLO|nr:Transmembrane 9 superfamily member 1 like protein [Verticillium longisporum]KAG7135400.1 Transmembrane 9 superfamily member 1 like protein [Verticillium longisporum]
MTRCYRPPLAGALPQPDTRVNQPILLSRSYSPTRLIMMHSTLGAPLAAALLALPQLASAFYLPGVAPTSYEKGEKVPLNVNSIKPVAAMSDSRLHSVISYEYYHPAFKFCQPEEGPQSVSESLGSILFGDRIMTSPFELLMLKDEKCKPLCIKKYPPPAVGFMKRRIEQGYSLNWLVDGLPAGQQIQDDFTNTTFYNPGFLMGGVDEDGNIVFNNHYDINIEYHPVSGSTNQYRVVGVIVEPSSRAYPNLIDCNNPMDPIVFEEDGSEKEVKFSYSVYWTKSETAWATRWDKYLHVFDPKIHWFWLIDTAIIVVILIGTVASILVRALKKDIARYNRLDHINLDDLSGTGIDEDDGVQEDSGWKLVHGDVFRTPKYPLLLSVLLGTGAQLFVMTGFTICFALLGFLSPSNRGSLGTMILLLYTVLGFVGGYVSSRTYKAMQGEKWKVNIAMTPLLVPSIVFASFFLLDLFLWAKQSSGAVPLTTMLIIILIWFIISIPLSVAGSWLGFRANAIESPVRTNQIPRQVPPVTTYLKPVPSMLIVGLLPFGAIFVELYFIMSSVWFSRIYYMFGFLFLSYGLMVVTCAAVTILMVYFLLCAENYHWQWRAFLAAGTCGGYIFANSLLYLVTKLKLSSLAGGVLYIGYSALISFLFFILTGSIGYFASWWFVRRIYASIKID